MAIYQNGIRWMGVRADYCFCFNNDRSNSIQIKKIIVYLYTDVDVCCIISLGEDLLDFGFER